MLNVGYITLYSDEYDSVKQTALHYSMTNTRWGVMETLVKAGADVNCRRMKDGWTPLFLASIFGYSYKAQYLIDSGADVLLCDDLGWTPDDWADKYGLVAVRKIIRYWTGERRRRFSMNLQGSSQDCDREFW